MFEHLVRQGLVKEKKYPNGLRVFKYSRKVFYDALWNTDPLLLEARGMVLDSEGNKVMWPFTKVFNFKENGTTCEPDELVNVIYKVNGFLGVVGQHKGEVVYGTTGTLDSEFALMVRKHVEPHNLPLDVLDGFTWMFEICDPSDPHIVEEESGAWLIGIRRNSDGALATESQLDEYADRFGFKRPTYDQMYFEEAVALSRSAKNEGFMIRDAWTDEYLMKIKSPYYLGKKFLMRMSKGKVEQMFTNKQEFLKTLDEEFYDIVEFIVESYTLEEWTAKTDQERRSIIEEYFNDIV